MGSSGNDTAAQTRFAYGMGVEQAKEKLMSARREVREGGKNPPALIFQNANPNIQVTTLAVSPLSRRGPQYRRRRKPWSGWWWGR